LLEPQSTALFILLMAAFCSLLAWVAFTKQTVFRVLAASLAFIPAMLFGVAAVNKYYNYYQTWSSAAADFGAQGNGAMQAVGSNMPSEKLTAILNRVTQAGAARQQGETVQFVVAGRTSHITRVVDVYLPPQYFRPGYRNYRFPAVELITGNPGQPQDWVNVVGITQTFLTLLGDGVVKPAVLVMPDANGGRQFSLQCLNIPHGPEDAQFLAKDLPRYLARTLRLQLPGPAWGIAGYSEGGYCAANLSLIYRLAYGYVGVLSGYFKPGQVRFGNPPHSLYPFRKSKRLRRLNNPIDRVHDLPVSARVPQFWLGAGNLDAQDVIAARAFQRLLLTRQPDVQVHLAPGGGHTMTTWRALIPGLLEWMTPGLARAASLGLPADFVHKAQPPGVPLIPVGAGRGASSSPGPSGPVPRTIGLEPGQLPSAVPSASP
jgi:enterochelin esterase-like enzyme